MIVAPFVGAWIEIDANMKYMNYVESLPSWERGLKFFFIEEIIKRIFVAPFVGAWIEIVYASGKVYDTDVAPFVGAWIEILDKCMART